MNNTILLALGNFYFHMDSLAYEEMQRSSNYGWQEVQRIGTHPQLQNTGTQKEEIRLTGMLLPHFKGAGSLDNVRDLAQRQAPLLLCSDKQDSKNNMGYWVIKSIDSTASRILTGGQARIVQFAITLSYFGTNRHGNYIYNHRQRQIG